MKPRKRFGQHFLTDPGVLDEMSRSIALSPDDTVLEIGPGQGALTDVLYPQLVETGRYVAVEIDRDLVPWLQARHGGIKIINADFNRLDLVETLSGITGWRVVGNLPYNVSSAIIMNLSEYLSLEEGPSPIQDMHFMVQKEMGLRLAASAGSKAWGRLSVMAQLVWRVEYLFEVGPESFSPPPKVFSSVIRLMPILDRVSARQYKEIDRVVRVAFAQRRKRLSNALKSLQVDWSEVSVDPQKRADDVDVGEFMELADAITIEQ
ncbi:MAG: 16S rRNA (adenine(1518)-N(6)/adenine(1519)-N(6))-dimethyltransferase RsmA [Pseudomonadota bacterium]